MVGHGFVILSAGSDSKRSGSERNMLYIVTAERPPTKRLGPIGRCIYCDRKPPERQLEEEHVIADGLGGWMSLIDASCRPCAEKIHPFETTVMANNFGLVRAAKGIKSKKRRGRKKRPNTHFETRLAGGGLQRVPIAPDMPHANIFHHFGKNKRATILTGEDPKSRLNDINISPLGKLIQNMRGRPSFTLPAVNPLSFYRFLAKTAHSAAYCLSPSGGFKPYLRHLILEGGEDHAEAATFIGTTDEVADYNEAILHAVEIDWVESDAFLPLLGSVRKKLLIAKIDLFVNSSVNPTYEVVVGESDNAAHRILPRDRRCSTQRRKKSLSASE